MSYQSAFNCIAEDARKCQFRNFIDVNTNEVGSKVSEKVSGGKWLLHHTPTKGPGYDGSSTPL